MLGAVFEHQLGLRAVFADDVMITKCERPIDGTLLSPALRRAACGSGTFNGVGERKARSVPSNEFKARTKVLRENNTPLRHIQRDARPPGPPRSMGRNFLSTRERPWGGELLTTLSGRGQGGSFRCKTVSTASVRKGAMTRRTAVADPGGGAGTRAKKKKKKKKKKKNRPWDSSSQTTAAQCLRGA